MYELWLNFQDPDGEERREPVGTDRFTIGRHSSSNLCVVDSSLSREHAVIERIGDRFEIDDHGSSNGTTLNGQAVRYPMVVRDGDEIVLGGSLVIKAEICKASNGHHVAKNAEETPGLASVEAVADVSAVPMVAAAPVVPAPAPVKPASSKGSLPASVFIIAPLLGLFVLAVVGGLIYFFSGKKQPVVASSDREFQYSASKDDDDEDDAPVKKTPDPASPKTDTGTPSNTGPLPDTPANTGSQPGPSPATGENAKVEQNGGLFLRRIAQNDPKAFLTAEQAKRLSTKLKQMSGSSAVADNIASARRNASQLKALAASKNLKPQLLAAAAIAKLGTSRGDVLKTAASMADVLDKLGTQIGSESGDDALLMIAAYDQGAAGDFLKMRNMLQDLANKFPESARSIRSIWFLEKNGKITPAEFDNALTFLAVGSITQNPKDFGVNAEALIL